MDLEFLNTLRQAYPYGIGYAVQHREEGHSLSVELGLASEDYCNHAIHNPIVINDIPFHAIRTFPTSLTRFNFSGVPMESPIETKDTLHKIFSQYGKVIDIVLHLDDGSSTWFRGNGHILVEAHESTPEQPGPSYKLDYNAKTAILVTWDKMPKHCRYCKAMGHSRDICPERPTETRTCFTCGVKGHLSVKCSRAMPAKLEHSKRSRLTAPTPIPLLRPMATPRGTLTSKYFTVDQPADTMPSLDTEDTPKTTNTSSFDPSEKMNTADETPETTSPGSNNTTAMYDLSSADSSIFGEIDVNDLMNTNDQTPKDHEDILSMDEENDSTDTLTQQSSSSPQQISHSHSRNSLKAKKIAPSARSPYSRSTRPETKSLKMEINWHYRHN